MALDRHTTWGAWPWLVRTQVDHARLLLHLAAPGDREQAGALLDLALAGAERIGMHRVADEIRDLRDGGRTGRPSTVGPKTAAGGGDALRREGDVWAVVRGDRVVRVRDSRGMRYLARLLAQPGSEVHVLELAGAPLLDAPGEAVLDQQAKAAYRARLTDLTDDLAQAEADHDPERTARLQHELQFLERELAAAVGLGGRDRVATTQAERARVAVTKAIRTAIRHIGEHDPTLGRYLDLTIQTGRFCRYTPPAEQAPWHPTVQAR